MKKYRTPQKNRTNYVYYDNSGHKVITLNPGENGVTQAQIAILHRFDDEECRLQHQDTRNDSKYKPQATASLEELDGDGVWIASNSPNPLETFIRKETISSVQKAIGKLPVAQREAITAVWLEEMLAKDYAKFAGKTESAVSQLLDRAFKNLRKMLS